MARVEQGMQREGVCFLIFVHMRRSGCSPRRDPERVRGLVCLLDARGRAWWMKAAVTAELSELSVQEEGDVQVRVLRRCVSTPTGPRECEAGHVFG